MDRLLAAGGLLATWGTSALLLAPAVIPDNPVLPLGDLTSPAGAKKDPAKRELSIVWVGDITPGSRYGTPPDQGRALFARVREPCGGLT